MSGTPILAAKGVAPEAHNQNLPAAREQNLPAAHNQNLPAARDQDSLEAHDKYSPEAHNQNSQNDAAARERVVYAAGWGAFGQFTVTQDLTAYTRAKLFSRVGKMTEVLVRLSVRTEHGAGPLAERDLHGFSVKFYTEEGNWDLVGNNTPVFFVRDAAKFPVLVKVLKRDPDTGLRSATALWDFCSANPETLHQVTILFSDRGLPASPRVMDGYGGHTFSFYNEAGERSWVKFHVKAMPGQGDAENAAADGNDLTGAIARGDFPQWRLCVQIMSEADARKAGSAVFDITKIWPEDAYPLHELGTIELNRNAGNAFADVEQAAFSPSNVVPGIGFSPDRMLQARIFAYADAHRHRLGLQYAALPVNAPRVVQPRIGGTAHGNATAATQSVKTASPAGKAAAKTAALHGEDDDFAQAGEVFRRMDDAEKQRFFRAIAEAMQGVPADIVERQIALFRRCDPAYGDGVERVRPGG